MALPESRSKGARADPNLTIVTRLLWPGIGRMVLEESRHLAVPLVVYRQDSVRQVYKTDAYDVSFLRNSEDSGPLTPFLRRATLMFNPDRGPGSTIDLDLIWKAVGAIRGPALFHDQFAGLTGLMRQRLRGEDYALYVHETSLGDRQGVMDATLTHAGLAAPLRVYDRQVIRGAKSVFTNSQRNQKILRDEGVSSIVAYPGTTPIPAPASDRDRFVLAVALWERTKRPEVYVELARRSGVRVVMAGMWGHSSEMESFRRSAGDLVTVTGAISEQELDRLSRTAALYARFGFAERGPGQGGVQALGYGMPVLSNSGLAISELITNGETGYVVDSVEEAASRVGELFQNPPLMKRMSLNAWELSKDYTWEVHAARIREGLGFAA